MSSLTPIRLDTGSGLSSRRPADHAFLDRLSWGLVRAVSEPDIVDFALDLILQETRAESCWLTLAVPESDELRLAGARSTSRVTPKLDPKFASWVATTGSALRFDDTRKDARCGEGGFDLESQVGSLLCLPLAASGVRGVLSLGSRFPEAFSDPDECALSRAADGIAAALDRARRARESGSDERVEDYRQRLARAEKMSSLGGLLAGIVHELNNPLTTILGFSQLLARTAGQNKSLETIIAESERCARIVESVLRIARPGEGDKENVDLNAAIRETLELASYQLRLNQVMLGMNLTCRNPRAWVNPNELTQVLLNLVTNAVQAIGAAGTGSGRVGVATDVAGPRVRIQVEDTGPGIDQANLGRIFDPFFTTKPSGTGLGLSLSRRMIEDNGGSIRVDSVPGEGATFTIEFPLAGGDPERTPEPRKRILVVDDEPHILELVEAVLSDKFIVESVSSGPEAIERLATGGFDLLISDLRMPGVGGVELIEWARTNHEEFRVLMLTGDIVSSGLRDYIARSGASCLSKPFKIDDLIASVEKIMDAGAPCVEIDDAR